MLKTLVAALALVLVAVYTPAFAEEAKLVRSISISGHGEVLVVPDVAQVSMGVTSFGNSAREALDVNTKSMQSLLQSLKAAGIDSRDITTSNFSINPRLNYGENNAQPPKLVGYDVNNMVTAVIRKLDTVGAVLDGAVSSGSNQINGINFSVSKSEAMLDEARKNAIADAKRKAQVYATTAGFELGSIISVNEGGGFQPPVPMMSKARSAVAEDVPISQGEQALAIDVNVVWAIE